MIKSLKELEVLKKGYNALFIEKDTKMKHSLFVFEPEGNSHDYNFLKGNNTSSLNSIEEVKEEEEDINKVENEEEFGEIIESVTFLLQMNYVLIGPIDKDGKRFTSNSFCLEFRPNGINGRILKVLCLVVQELVKGVLIFPKRLQNLLIKNTDDELAFEQKIHFEPLILQPKIKKFNLQMCKGDAPRCILVSVFETKSDKNTKINMFFKEYDPNHIKDLLIQSITQLAIDKYSEKEEMKSVVLFRKQDSIFKKSFDQVKEKKLREFLVQNKIKEISFEVSYIPGDPAK